MLYITMCHKAHHNTKLYKVRCDVKCMPTVTIYLDSEKDNKINSLKNHFNVASKTDVVMKIIGEYLNTMPDKEKKPTK